MVRGTHLFAGVTRRVRMVRGTHLFAAQKRGVGMVRGAHFCVYAESDADGKLYSLVGGCCTVDEEEEV